MNIHSNTRIKRLTLVYLKASMSIMMIVHRLSACYDPSGFPKNIVAMSKSASFSFLTTCPLIFVITPLWKFIISLFV